MVVIVDDWWVAIAIVIVFVRVRVMVSIDDALVFLSTTVVELHVRFGHRGGVVLQFLFVSEKPITRPQAYQLQVVFRD